ncbi:hypothetical protein CEUSTIGMA_g8829.t1 [Chlamydomonas eustigma]|uniref:Uncharacterized protein n=1 Tax=Chlamydomonas eustigma TaxID=1157962 RepID=A0A250XE87_9CHLO|nr:hypothetical protein CEUSTIGMA_g8829.t1 [Chlamydomonas eustigma]|eukprot:GAX81398.1 hypothetical protein CEUSTIGMA_g8829.t1 [Chlamydomonas eustigma]
MKEAFHGRPIFERSSHTDNRQGKRNHAQWTTCASKKYRAALKFPDLVLGMNCLESFKRSLVFGSDGQVPMILAAEGDGLALGTLGTSDRPVDMISTAGREGSAPAEFVCTSPARTITAEEEDSALGTCDGPVAMMSATEGEGSAPAVCFFPSPVRTFTVTPDWLGAMISATVGEGKKAASSKRLHMKHRHRVIMCSRRNGEINRSE